MPRCAVSDETDAAAPPLCEKLLGVMQSEKHPAKVAKMFDSVAPRYEIITDLISLGQDRRWRRAATAALHAQPGDLVLDVAAGTGASSAVLARTGAEVCALDISPGMVAVGHHDHPDIDFVVGDAQSLPFADETFDAVTVSFGLRNMPDPQRVLAELARVTKPGGRLVICELSTPPWRVLQFAHHIWIGRVMPLIARLSSNPASYRYLTESIVDWPGPTTIAEWAAAAGWRHISFKRLTGGIVTLHWGNR